MYDVVIVGASIAGCTAATLYGRAGLRVALVEKHRRPDAFKALCGHFVLGGTEDMLRRNGFWQPMLDAGGVPGGITVRTPAGWLERPADAPTAMSLRRQVLDPLLRGIAAQTAGVELLLGRSVIALVEHDGRVVGVRTRDAAGAEEEFRGRLVVGADGYRSTVATLAAAPEDRAPNHRFGMWAYFRGLPAGDNRLWQLEPDVAIRISTDDGLGMLVAFPAKQRLPEFREDAGAALRRFFLAVPDGPDLGDAEQASKVVGMNDYPCVRRPPAPRPGLVLVGDAATTGDPLPAVGCGWAFRSAEWLVEATVPALRADAPMGRAVTAYERSLRFIRRHDDVARDDALARPPNAIQRLVLRGAAVDPIISRRAYLFAMKVIPVSGFLRPSTLARAGVAALSRRRTPATVTR